MVLSRRRFLGRTALATASLAVWRGAGAVDTCEGAAAPDIDFNMGFPPDAIRLNRNENPLGPSPRAVAAAMEGVPLSARYADSILLRSLLARHHDLDEDWILVGTGSGELLKLAPLVYAREGGNLVSTLETYRSTPSFAEKLGARVKWVKLSADAAYDIDGLLSAVDGETKILYTVHPNNPTGTAFRYDDLKQIADALPREILFLIDEAYIHFLPDGKTGVDLLKEGYRNVLVTRTFSKAHALAGLRIGYGLGHPDIMSEIAKFGCGPTSTNMAGFGAAVASLEDDGHIMKSRAYGQRVRMSFEAAFGKMGLRTIAGAPLFMMVEVGPRATAVRDALIEKKIYVRDGAEWDMPGFLRVSYGREEENQAFLKELPGLL